MIVREMNWAGPCFNRGVLVRETAQFYVIEPWGFESRKRIKKSDPSIHLKPCHRCVDHPNTDYPRGYEG